MYAVIRTGGKQYRVQKGDIINVEKITPKRKNAKKITFSDILLVKDNDATVVGKPIVEGYEGRAGAFA